MATQPCIAKVERGFSPSLKCTCSIKIFNYFYHFELMVPKYARVAPSGGEVSYENLRGLALTLDLNGGPRAVSLGCYEGKWVRKGGGVFRASTPNHNTSKMLLLAPSPVD